MNNNENEINETISLDGNQYKLTYDNPLSQEQRNDVIKQIRSLYLTMNMSNISDNNLSNQNLNSNRNIQSLGTCGSSYVQGSTHTVSMTVPVTALGTSPYTYRFYVNGVEDVNMRVGPTTSTTYSQNRVFNDIISAGNVYKGEVTDSCTPSGVIASDSCTVPVTAPPVTICTWITNNGGIHPLPIANISTLKSAYLGYTSLGFIIYISYISGAKAYYLGYISSGNSFTGCSFS